jgi:signal transduction histidine kinase
MPRPTIRSISGPIALTSVAVTLSIAMLVGWTLVIGQAFFRGPERHDAGGMVLLVLGIVSFGVIMTVLVLFGISLVREIWEARRQVSFIDSVTHELKSPLASLRLCLQTLSRQNLDEGRKAQLQEMMLADVDRLNAFIEDILQASRVTAGRVRLLVAEFALDGLVDDCRAHVLRRHRLPEEAVEITGPSKLQIATDRTALQTVVENLLDNAVKYSDPPVRVRVHAGRRSDGRVFIEVRDQGIGIDGRDIKRIFQRFYRVPDEAVRSRRGTGLGLFVVFAIVRSLHGKVEAESPGRGQGTTLRVILPRHVARIAAEPSAEAASSGTPSPGASTS